MADFYNDHGSAQRSQDSFTRTLLRPWSFTSQTSSSSDPANVEREAVKFRGKRSPWERPLLSLWRNDAEAATGAPGLWQDQMLFDRSLRLMTALMTVYALVMTIVSASKLKALYSRQNYGSTSVGFRQESTCKDLQKTEIMIQLIINIAATTILGMSNTYQQLVTSLDIDEVRWSMSKFGDCRVGTNSPTAICRKRSGKLKAWSAWWLLICTSLPVHFFANSVIGPSNYITPPNNISFVPHSTGWDFASGNLSSAAWNSPTSAAPVDDWGFSAACWIFFRTGDYSGWRKLPGYEVLMSKDEPGFPTSITVDYSNANCSAYARTSTFQEMAHEIDWDAFYEDLPGSTSPGIGNCTVQQQVFCTLADRVDIPCRMTIRMSAALVLTACLIIKAMYMVLINVRGRRRKKTQCLTFGDTVVASVVDSRRCIKNECLVNAGEAYRHSTSHSCHKHCTNKVDSSTGDEIGHCQKCRKFNHVDRAADLQHPCIATKYKKSLLANLGSSALTQMIILSLTSAVLLGVSIMLAVFMGMAAHKFKVGCKNPPYIFDISPASCAAGLRSYLQTTCGGFGGFDSTASVGILPSNQASSEMLAFAISNGAQFLYSLLYLLLIYNFTLISMEYDWGQLETKRSKLRCTIMRGPAFRQTYLLQLPKKVIYPMMSFSSLMHWLLSQAVSTKELVWAYNPPPGARDAESWEFSQYEIVYGSYAVFLATVLMIAMTSACYAAFTYKREGFIPQMYGSMRVCCAATTRLRDFSERGVQWGDLSAMNPDAKFRHAGLSVDEVGKIVPAELYAGSDDCGKDNNPDSDCSSPRLSGMKEA